MLTDPDIMVRVQAGETGLFTELVSRYRPRLFHFALSKTGDHALAEDLVQETFLAAYAARDSYSPRFAFSTWIWTILLNLSRQAHRRRQRQSEVLAAYGRETAASADPQPDGLHRLLRQETEERLHQALNRLPEEEADALRLRFFGGMKYDEIALAMDSSVSGAKVRVKRGLQRLSGMLGEESPS
jgi:RNA polymerase sigma-70 factor, ECF subfamily